MQLQENTLFDPLTLTLGSHEMLPSTLYIMWPMHIAKFEVATSNGLGGDTFTETWQTHPPNHEQKDYGPTLVRN